MKGVCICWKVERYIYNRAQELKGLCRYSKRDYVQYACKSRVLQFCSYGSLIINEGNVRPEVMKYTKLMTPARHSPYHKPDARRHRSSHTSCVRQHHLSVCNKRKYTYMYLQYHHFDNNVLGIPSITGYMQYNLYILSQYKMKVLT
jgi:hypothetical protein